MENKSWQENIFSRRNAIVCGVLSIIIMIGLVIVAFASPATLTLK